MTALTLELRVPRARLGVKGPRAAEWLLARGIELPAGPNSWASFIPTGCAEPLLVARLGGSEFFLEDGIIGQTLTALEAHLDENPPGVYPVLRTDAAFLLSGDGVHDALAQVCNVNFAELSLESHPVIMTLMIGVAVLLVAEESAGRRYRIWCDPSFGSYLGESLGEVVSQCGGKYTGVPA
jgi:sarcosine oxidase, subunit gamma